MDVCVLCGHGGIDLIREFFRRLPANDYGVSLRCGWVCADRGACAERQRTPVPLT